MDISATRHWRFSTWQLMAAIAGVACLLGGLVWAQRSGGLWWLTQSFEIGVYFYPAFAVAAGVGLLMAVIAAVWDRSVWRLRSLWLLLPAAMPIIILAYGVAFRYDDIAGQAVIERRRQIVEWLPWLHLPIGLILLGCFRSVSRCLIIVGITVASVWLTFGTSIMSWMSVTNQWP
jgi:hypothetical protein